MLALLSISTKIFEHDSQDGIDGDGVEGRMIAEWTLGQLYT
jgi:hypothetical protein